MLYTCVSVWLDLLILLLPAAWFSDSEIRRCVLESLDSRFDQHLAQAENLASLFIALNDEKYDIRCIAMIMIGRLSVKNPAYVMPSLRKVLIQVELPNVIKKRLGF